LVLWLYRQSNFPFLITTLSWSAIRDLTFINFSKIQKVRRDLGRKC
jgi:hypothetical protein